MGKNNKHIKQQAPPQPQPQPQPQPSIQVVLQAQPQTQPQPSIQVVLQQQPQPQPQQQYYSFNIITVEHDKLIQEHQLLKQEFQSVKQENQSLNTQILLFQLTIKEHLGTIKELKEENEKLKEIIKFMKNEINQLTEKINMLEINNIKQYEENIKQKEKLKIYKLRICIQDTNELLQIEKINPQYYNKFKKLREIRNSECHLIRENDTHEEQNFKLYYIKKFINSLTPDFIKQFELSNKNLTGIIPIIKRLLYPYEKNIINNIEAYNDITEEIEEFFDDIYSIQEE